VLEILVAEAAARELVPTVMTFDPHPLTLVAPDRAPRRLTTIPQRIDRFAEVGIECVAVLQFTDAVRDMAPEAFITDLLVDRLQSALVVAGVDFGFGANRGGDVALLERYGDSAGFEVVASPLFGSGQPVSSTRIRELLVAGKVAAAAGLLGRSYELAASRIRRRSQDGVELVDLVPEPGVVVPGEGSYSGTLGDEPVGLIVAAGVVVAVAGVAPPDGYPVFHEQLGDEVGSEPVSVLERVIGR
jgi:riboflavin kinase/FMN adenylyltransferase